MPPGMPEPPCRQGFTATVLSRPRRAAVVAAVVVAVGVAAIGIPWAARSPASRRAQLLAPLGPGSVTGVPPALAPGRFAPQFVLPALRPGQAPVSLAAVRGAPAVVNFFASWCAPCKAELPLLAAAWRRYGTSVHFVGVDVSDARGSALALAQQDRAGYALAADTSGSVASAYQLLGLPDTVFVDAGGRVVVTHVGQLHPGSLDSALQLLAPG